ncbi:PREDICTED: snRNA-activating protein complex subunit 1, partial [Nanorana parkeri]|uniref:snRNA-activating protein complex subunit 1 n=1 Tax=Nanorana parkeri TaxID=125878 RepID=UPI000854BEB9
MNFLGLKEDCETLLSRFQDTDSVRYEEFLAIWKEMKFHTIFFGGMRNLESNRFAREAFSVVSPYFLPPYTFQIRVGALYVMYGLYNAQLCEPKQKIRIALKDWSEVEKFNQDLISAQHLDAVYIFRQMRRSRAFYFTAMPTMLTFKPQRSIPTDDGKEEFKDVRDRVADLITSECVEEMINVHEHYQKTKSLTNADKSEPDKSLSLIKEDFTDNLNFLVSQYQHWRQDTRAPRTKSDEEKQGTSQDSEGSERARVLAALKSKSYTAVTQAAKSRRHRQVQLASSESGSDYKSTKSERAKAKRMKRKADKAAQKQAYLSLTKKRRSVNMPAISEEDSSSSNEEIPVKK